MKHIIDLEYLMGKYSNDEILVILYKHACELKITALAVAIATYWATPQVSEDDLKKVVCQKPREQSSKEQANL